MKKKRGRPKQLQPAPVIIHNDPECRHCKHDPMKQCTKKCRTCPHWKADNPPLWQRLTKPLAETWQRLDKLEAKLKKLKW